MSFGGRVVVLSKDNTNVVGKRHPQILCIQRLEKLNVQADCSVCISITFICIAPYTRRNEGSMIRRQGIEFSRRDSSPFSPQLSHARLAASRRPASEFSGKDMN